MDLGICGIIDIVIVVLAIIVAIIGYKKGFMKKFLSIFGILAIIIFSLSYCGQFSQWLIHNELIYPSIESSIYSNISEYITANGYNDLTVGQVIAKALEIPEFIANIVARGIPEGTANELASSISTYLATSLMNIIAFLILVVGLLICLAILKIVVFVLRANKFIRTLDGILGLIFYVSAYSVVVLTLFYFLSIVIDMEWFSKAKEWLVVDMQLGNDNFRISKAFYEGNVLKRIIDIIFNL